MKTGAAGSNVIRFDSGRVSRQTLCSRLNFLRQEIQFVGEFSVILCSQIEQKCQRSLAPEAYTIPLGRFAYNIGASYVGSILYENSKEKFIMLHEPQRESHHLQA